MQWELKATASIAAFVFLGTLPSIGSAASMWAFQGSDFDLEGTIQDQSAGKLTIGSGDGIIFHVVYDQKCSIVRPDGSAGSEQDLKVGLKVHIFGTLDESGKVKARRIEILDKSVENASPEGSS